MHRVNASRCQLIHLSFVCVPHFPSPSFMANCIGRNNHRFFLGYLWLQTLLMLWGVCLNLEPLLSTPASKKSFWGHVGVMVIMCMQLCVAAMLGYDTHTSCRAEHMLNRSQLEADAARLIASQLCCCVQVLPYLAGCDESDDMASDQDSRCHIRALAGGASRTGYTQAREERQGAQTGRSDRNAKYKRDLRDWFQ